MPTHLDRAEHARQIRRVLMLVQWMNLAVIAVKLEVVDAVELRVATALGAREVVVHVEAWD